MLRNVQTTRQLIPSDTTPFSCIANHTDCSVCTENYSKSLVFTCTKCVDDGGGIAILVLVAVFGLGAAIALYMHLVSEEMDGTRRGIIHRFTTRLPLQSIKIVVVVWQILTQVSRCLTMHTWI